MAVHSNSQKRICNSVSPLSLTPDWFVIDYNQCWDKGRAAGTTAPDTAKQRGKEWMQGGTPILWHVLTVGGGVQFWILAQGAGGPCPSSDYHTRFIVLLLNKPYQKVVLLYQTIEF